METTKKSLDKALELPEGVSAEVTPTSVTITGPNGSVSRAILTKIISITLEGNTIHLKPKKRISKNEKRIINTLHSLFANAVTGVTEGFVYKLKICSSHFPMSVKLNGKNLEVTNFMGEKIPRKLTIKEGVDAKLDGEMITITSPDKELAGIVATDIEKMTRRPAFDRRVFMDGIYLIEKAGVKLE